jgi:hypothetical protein
MFFCWPYYLRCSLFGLVATLRFCEGRTRLKSGATMELHRLAQYLAAAYPDNKFLKQKKCKFRKKSFKTWKKNVSKSTHNDIFTNVKTAESRENLLKWRKNCLSHSYMNQMNF